VEDGRLNRVRKQAEESADDDGDSATSFLNEFTLNFTRGGRAPVQRSPGCRSIIEYEACVNQGATGRGGGSPAFCSRQFC
jgi:hypothetical protein